MWKNLEPIFWRYYTILFLALGLLAIILEMAASSANDPLAARALSGGVVGWLIDCWVFIVPAALMRGLRGRHISWWIAFIWTFAAFFGRIAVFAFLSVKQPVGSVTLLLAIVVCWQLLRWKPKPGQQRPCCPVLRLDAHSVTLD